MTWEPLAWDPALFPSPAPAAAGPAVALRGVTVRFRGQGRAAVDGLDLTVPRGTVFGLLGPNGSGKTTTISLITGLIAPGRGSVHVFGLPPRDARRTMGVVSQETALYGRLTTRFNLTFHAWLYGYSGLERRERVDAALRLANLSGVARQKAGTLSGGMQRRLAIARALLHAPQLVILDEPTLGVDPAERAGLWEHIRVLAAAGKTVLLSTNILEEAQELCDLVAIMRSGQLAAAAQSPASLQRRYGALVITVTLDAGEQLPPGILARLEQIPGVTSAETGGGPGPVQVRVMAADAGGVTGHVVMLLAGHGTRIRDVASAVPGLDEVFRKLTGPRQDPR